VSYFRIDPSVSVRACPRVFGRCALRFLVALVLTALQFVACSKQSDTASRASGPTTLRIGIAIPKLGTPGTGARSLVNYQIFDSIVGIGWDGRPVDRAVTNWKWSDDQLDLRLTLRSNLQFHDGTPINVPFFKESLERLFKAAQDAQAKQPSQARTNVSLDSITGVSIVGENEVAIRLSRPEAFLLTDLANLSLTLPDKPEVGFGPYRLTTRDPKTRLAAFDKYYRGRPEIDVIEVEEFEELRGSWAALMRGEIDAVHEITPGAIDFMQAEGQTTVNTFPFTRPYYIQLLFNVNRPALKNVAVRQALSYAVDRQALIDSGLSRQGTVAEGPIWPFHWAYSTAQKNYAHNSEAATLRLESAGLKMKPSKEPGRMPSRLRLRCLTVSRNATFEKIALVLQKQLYEVGIDMEIDAVPGSELMKRVQSGDYDTILIERTSGRSLAWTYLTFHSSASQLGYKAADTVLDRLRGTTDEAKIRTAVSDLQQIFFEDPPAIFIAWPQVARVVSTKFLVRDEEGRELAGGKPTVRDDKARDVWFSLWQWRRAEPQR
jgi:peptide/nickel transport system substrate-binding protein